MKTNDIKQIRDAFARLSKGAKITEFLEQNTVKVETDYSTYNDNISFYAYMIPASKKIYLTDAGRVYTQLFASGQKIQDGVVQSLVESYGLVMLENNNLVEQQDLPLHERVSNIIQVQIGVDAIIRTWISYSNKIKKKKEN